jgi:hypothetical protein
MYWYKSTKRFASALTGIIVFITCLTACKPAIKETGASLKYFDLKGYFEKDSARLAKMNPLILKTVTHNGVTETKKVHIANWGAELNFFKSSDINRPAWRDSYTIQADSNYLIYNAKVLDLKTRSITIKLVNGKVKWILISNYTKNMLYMTREMLTYFPDSLYKIDKMQAVRVIGINRYKITGAFTQ